MGAAGYILAGGNSVRMGKDKALLPVGGITLVQTVARLAQQVAESVAIVGDPAKYGGLGYPAIGDTRPGEGPVAGIETALLHTNAEWNLVLACDLANLNAGFLRRMVERIPGLGPEIQCLVPRTGEGRLQPLCALYRRGCLSEFSLSLDGGRRKLLDTVAKLRTEYTDVPEEDVFQNVNTPAEWNRYLNDRIN